MSPHDSLILSPLFYFPAGPLPFNLPLVFPFGLPIGLLLCLPVWIPNRFFACLSFRTPVRSRLTKTPFPVFKESPQILQIIFVGPDGQLIDSGAGQAPGNLFPLFPKLFGEDFADLFR